MPVIRYSLYLVLLAITGLFYAGCQSANKPGSAETAASAPAPTNLPPPLQMTAQQDRQKMMEILNITSLRSGRNGSNPQATNAANYDESKANPFPNLPDPLTLKNGGKVTTARAWWNQRRPELVEDFDREIYGRVPKKLPKV